MNSTVMLPSLDLLVLIESGVAKMRAALGPPREPIGSREAAAYGALTTALIFALVLRAVYCATRQALEQKEVILEDLQGSHALVEKEWEEEKASLEKELASARAALLAKDAAAEAETARANAALLEHCRTHGWWERRWAEKEAATMQTQLKLDAANALNARLQAVVNERSLAPNSTDGDDAPSFKPPSSAPPPLRRPRGRAPRGKVWDTSVGWVPEDARVDCGTVEDCQ